MIFFKSLTPDVTAEKCTQTAPADCAKICARVVLPLPGGPQRMREPSLPDAAMPLRSLPGPRRCSWPTNSSRVVGRILSASGWEAFCDRDDGDPNKSMLYATTAIWPGYSSTLVGWWFSFTKFCRGDHGRPS